MIKKPINEEEAIKYVENVLTNEANNITAVRRAYRCCPNESPFKLIVLQKLRELEIARYGKTYTKGEDEMAEQTAPKKDIKKFQGEQEGLVYQVFDMLDSKEIARSLSQGIVSEKWCYHFKMGGRDIYGVSFEGAKQLAILTGGVLIDTNNPPRILSEDNNIIRVGAYGGLVKNGKIVFGIWGVAEQSKWFGAGHKNEKAFVVACSKAQRNAILSIIPENIRQQAIENWKKQGKVHEISHMEIEEETGVKDDVHIPFGEESK